MYVRQIFWGTTPPKYLTDVCPSNILGAYTPKILDRCMSVKCLGRLHSQYIRQISFRQMFGGSTPPKYLTNVVPSNIFGLQTLKYVTGVVPSNIFRVYTPKIHFTDVVLSNIPNI